VKFLRWGLLAPRLWRKLKGEANLQAFESRVFQQSAKAISSIFSEAGDVPVANIAR
jgi:hypothetical protein